MTEIAQFLFPGYNPYRLLVQQADLDAWVVTVSLAILLFSLAYRLGLRLRRNTTSREDKGRLNTIGLGLPDWRFVLAFTLPGYLVAISGQEASQLGYWVTGLIDQFLVFGIVFSSLLFLLKGKSSYLVPVILVQSLALALVSGRLVITASLVTVASALSRYEVPVKWRDGMILLVLAILLSITISTTRAVVGRYQFLAGGGIERVFSLVAGLQSLTGPDVNEAILGDFVYRFDGNSFGAMEYGALIRSQSAAGLEPLRNNFRLVIPAFLSPQKSALEVTMLEEESYMILRYGLPDLDYLPTTLGILFGYYGSVGLLIAAVALGWLFAAIDLWLHRTRTLFAVLIGIGLAFCVATMEQGLRTYFVTFRGIIVLYLLLVIVNGALYIVRGASRRFSAGPN